MASSMLSLLKRRGNMNTHVCTVFLLVVALVNVTTAQKAYIPDSNDPHAFNPTFNDPVAMRIAASTSYQIDSDVGAAEWAQLVPPGPKGHLVYVKDDASDPRNSSDVRPYTVTLFHQLKCLDVLRRQYMLPLLPESEVGSSIEARTPPVRPIARHCMNYLRQTVWCRPNLWIESAKNVFGTASRTYDAVCRDWDAIYDEASQNRAFFDGSA